MPLERTLTIIKPDAVAKNAIRKNAPTKTHVSPRENW